MVGIYKITSPSLKVYIGQSINIEKRWRAYYDWNVSKQYALKNSILKYGCKAHKFEIIHKLPHDVTQEVLNNYEILYWQLYKDCGTKMLNLKEPGSRGKNGESTRQKISIANKGRVSNNKGKTDWFKHTDEWKKKASERLIGNKSRTGMKNTPEAIEKTASSKRGIPRSEETKRRIGEPQKGKIIPEEQRRKISATLTGKPQGKKKPHTEEAKRKMSEALKGRIAWNKGITGYKIHTEDSKKRISEATIERYRKMRNN